MKIGLVNYNSMQLDKMLELLDSVEEMDLELRKKIVTVADKKFNGNDSKAAKAIGWARTKYIYWKNKFAGTPWNSITNKKVKNQ